MASELDGADSIGIHRCPNCRMLFSTLLQLQKHLDKFCSHNRLQSGSSSASVRRSGIPPGNNPQAGPMEPMRNEVERESSRLLRELAEYRKRNQEQRKADDDLQKLMAERVMEKYTGRKEVRYDNKPLKEIFREDVELGTDTFRRKVKNLNAVGDGITVNMNNSFRRVRSPSPKLKYVVRMSPKVAATQRPVNTESHLNMAVKIEELRAQMANLELRGALDPLTDFLLQINELRQTYLRNGGNDAEILKQLTQLQLETQALRKQNTQDSVRGALQVAANRDEDAEVARLQRENAALEAELIAARLQPPVAPVVSPSVPTVSLPGLYPASPYYYGYPPMPPIMPVPVPVAPEAPAEPTYAQRLQALMQTNLTGLNATNSHDDNLKGELSELRAEVRALREARSAKPTLKQDQNQKAVAAPGAPSSNLPKPGAVAQPDHPSDMYENQTNRGFRTGIVVFYDFVGGLDGLTHMVRLIVSTFSGNQEVNSPYVMQIVKCSVEPNGVNLALLNSRQPIEQLSPRMNVYSIAELQVGTEGRLETLGWLRIRIFDFTKHLIHGRFRAPFRVLPIRPAMRDEEYEKLPRFSTAELFYRVVDIVDSDAEMLVENALPSFAHTYGFAQPEDPDNASFGVAAALPGVEPMASNREMDPALFPGFPAPPNPPLMDLPQLSSPVMIPVELPPGVSLAAAVKRIGVRVCFVKHAEPGLAKVRIGIYQAGTGRVSVAGNSVMSAGTSAANQTFKHGYHIFGQEEALFDHPELSYDNLVIIRLYIRRETSRELPNRMYEPQSMYIKHSSADPEATVEFGEEELVAWTFMPLLVPLTPGALAFPDFVDSMRIGGPFRLEHMVVLTGLRTLPFFKPPVFDTTQIPYSQFYQRPLRYEPYGKAKIRVRIMAEDYYMPDNMSSSTLMSQLPLDDQLSRGAIWLPNARSEPPKKPFYPGDGFDVYIDGCRHLPEGVTVSRVVGVLFNRRWQRIGPTISALQLVESDIYNPQFDCRVEFRDPSLPPSLTILFTVISIERTSRKPTIVGYASLNVFCEIGTERQPEADQNMIHAALNEGGHQLRIYPDGPNRGMVFSNSWMKREKVRAFPAATLLVRLVRAVTGPYGQALSTDDVPIAEWQRLGLVKPRPLYRDRAYYTSSCEPWKGERAILVAQDKRPNIAALDLVKFLSYRQLLTPEAAKEFLQKTLLPKMDGDFGRLPEWNLSCVATYQPEYGFSLMLDVVYNIPWPKFTLALACLNPPAAFYMGPPYHNYDPIVFFTKLDWQNSTNKTAFFRDSHKHFRFRTYTKHLSAIIQLHELGFSTSGESLQIQLMDQAWCAVPIFIESFARTESIQVPLFSGAPSESQLSLLSELPYEKFIENMRQNGGARLIEKAFAVVRVSDARRVEEMLVSDEYKALRMNTNFLPLDLRAQYTQTLIGTHLLEMVPSYLTPAEFEKSLIERFKEMINISYEAAPGISIRTAPISILNTPTSTNPR